MAEILVGAVVDVNEVREIYSTEMTDPQLANFINMAYVTTNQLTLSSSELLKQIQLLLAAHFATAYDGIIKSQSVGSGEWSVTYAMVVGKGLNSSVYGQNAIALDASGKLAKLGMKRAKFMVASEYQFYGSTTLQTLVS